VLNRIILWALENRLLVVAGAALLLVYGGFVVVSLPVDVLPDLNRPTVTIMTEAAGLAPEEVETLVTFPIETTMNGATGVERVRSQSAVGLSVIYVEFGWNTDIYLARQIVNEKLQLARASLPPDVTPIMGPVSSIMGEVMLVGIKSRDGKTPPMDVRTTADWVVRPRLLTIPGISQVISIGGGRKQFQAQIDPKKLLQYDVTLEQVQQAMAGSNANTTGGFLEKSGQEFLIRNLARFHSIEELGDTVVATRGGSPVYLKNLGTVAYAPQIKRGDASVNAEAGVIISIQKQPGANTLALTKQVDQALDELQRGLPSDLVLQREVFRQSNFINAAIGNVRDALRDGAILVAVILFLFLLNFRTTFITLTAIPLSFIITFLVMRWFGLTVNTMTLGGLAVAIGELVDDAIVDVENVFRRLKENRERETPLPTLKVVFLASSEIRNSIVFATVIVVLVFIPLFALSGVEGRLFAPLAVAYIVSLTMSLIVSLTVTPVLASFLLPKAKIMEHGDSRLVKWLKWLDAKLLARTLDRPMTVIVGAALLFLVAAGTVPFLGGEFLPPFNEGSLTVNVLTQPGISLAESDSVGRIAERILLTVPEVKSTGRRTGRAELDEHAEGVHSTEIDCDLRHSQRSKEELIADIREKLSVIPGVSVNVGQPISHRIDHLLSGVRAQVAVKLFGDDLSVLRGKAEEIRRVMERIPGVTDLSVEKQVLIPQVRIAIKRAEASRYGLPPGRVAEALETMLNGTVVSQALDEQKTFDVVLRLSEPARNDLDAIRAILIDTPDGGKVPISALAEITEEKGPNQVLRENARRRIVVQCNVSGRDMEATIAEIQSSIRERVSLPSGAFIEYGGQFESQREATRRLGILAVFTLLAIFFVLLKALGDWRIALQVMANVPLAFIGGVIAVFLTGGVLSVASLIGFISLTGITVRNGIMMLSHYQHLMREEGQSFSREMIVRGSLERLVPVLMTALVAALSLIPLVLGADEQGKEILHPVAVVVLGGLITSTLLDQIVTPALFYRFGKPSAEKILREQHSTPVGPEPLPVAGD
jgi:CzcA family heavy metal efflux pump